jgi:hypothetical protein
MQQEFTIEFMEANCGCHTPEQLHSLSFMKESPITLKKIIQSEISLKDKYWFVCS